MKTTAILLSLFMTLSIFINAQNVNPKHVNYYKTPASIETNDYKIRISNIVSKVEYAKFGIKITNTGTNYLMFNKGESEFIYKNGKFSDKEKFVYILPTKSKTKTIKATGDNMFHTDTINFVLKGLYIIPAKGKVIKADEFKLPASKNSFEAENFNVKLIKLKQETKETYAKFECTYIGDKIGIIDPSKLSVKVDGKKDIEYANDNKKAKPILLRKGEKTRFSVYFHIPGKIADMQFSVLKINWNDTFQESIAKKIKAKTINFIVDEGLTNGKNK